MDRVELKENRFIRNAGVDDFSLINRLYDVLAVDKSNIERDYFHMLKDPDYICLILELSDLPIGFIICSIRTSLSFGKHMVIDEIVIDSNYQRKGHGQALVEHAVNLARDWRCNSMTLCCSEEKRYLHKFYESVGFEHKMRMYSKFVATKDEKKHGDDEC
jgi:GNAT superfamily N-acetyltransferase